MDFPELDIFNIDGRRSLLVEDNEGKKWIPLKPLCEVLDIDYSRQYQNINKDKILADKIALRKARGANNKMYNMVCIPISHYYGWVMNVRSKSEALHKYRLKCYDILHNYFKNARHTYMAAKSSN